MLTYVKIIVLHGQWSNYLPWIIYLVLALGSKNLPRQIGLKTLKKSHSKSNHFWICTHISYFMSVWQKHQKLWSYSTIRVLKKFWSIKTVFGGWLTTNWFFFKFNRMNIFERAGIWDGKIMRIRYISHQNSSPKTFFLLKCKKSTQCSYWKEMKWRSLWKVHFNSVLKIVFKSQMNEMARSK